MEINGEIPMEQAIVEAAERLFLEKGFVATSTTQIARAAGCNQALVHYYFRTKDNLFNTIFENKFRQFFQGIFEIKDIINLSFLEKIKYIIELHFDLLMKNQGIPALILNELSRQPEQMAILRKKLYTMPAKIFESLNAELNAEIQAGNIRKISFKDLLISIVSLNITLFMMMPVVEKVLELDNVQRDELIVQRKSQNVEFVLMSLRPITN